MKLRHFFVCWWPTMIVLAAVLWLTLAPDPVPDTGIELFPHADKIVHAVMMGGLASVVFFDYKRTAAHRKERLGFRPVMIMAICTALFAAVDEWAQGAMAIGRSSDFYDLLADWAGIILASLIVPPILNRYLQKA